MITLPIQIARRATQEAVYASYAFRRGALGLDPPWKVAQLGHAAWRYGLLGAIPAIASIRHGRDRAAVIDELGTFSYGELDDAANAVANHWRAEGLEPGDGVSILARNHRWFLIATFAAARCGARIVLLNTDFAGPQIRDVAAREGTDLLVHDDEYGDLLAGVETRLGRVRAWTDEPGADGDDTIAGLVARGNTSPTPRTGVDPKVVLLTSGTTGTPKGAPRAEPQLAGPGRCAALAGAVRGEGRPGAAGADVPHPRLRPGAAQRLPGLDPRRAPTVRPRPGAPGPRPSTARPAWSRSR